MMTGNEIREKFLEYFAERNHTVVDSSPLVPHDDPTLLFTNAGMVQFKRVFMGDEKRDYVRAATSQRCVRAGGKHNDLENVGYTARHHTFFEMLGNFSFGDYFKEEAIGYAWDFLTNVIGLPKEKLWVSVFEEDDEAFELWEKIDDLPKGRIVRLGESENFWAMGDTGPCGPCSEIHIDQGPEVGCGRADCKMGCDCDRYLEIWNLVFMQFYRDEDGSMTPLPKPSIDTGMGLERIAAVAQGQVTNYDSDLFSPIINEIAAMAAKKYGENEHDDTAMRVIADHARTTAFLVADGVLPSNEGRGYVLRRIMRRAIRFGRTLGLDKPFMAEIAAFVVSQMQHAYPHLNEAAKLLAKVAKNEEERFLETIDHGLAMLANEINRLQEQGGKTISGDFIFKLYDTYGFPVDIVKDIAVEKGLIADETGFNAAMEVQRRQSKKSWKGSSMAEITAGVKAMAAKGVKSSFVGYETRRTHAKILGMINDSGELTDAAQSGARLSIVCDRTPFYAEAGGQIGDKGEISGAKGRAEIVNTTSVADGLILHEAKMLEGVLNIDEEVELSVAEGRRQKIANNHTGTHLLHAALKRVLGEHVKQSGSLVEPERLRFDFTHFSPVTPQEMKKIERLVNNEIRMNTPVGTALLDREQAIKEGATALFGEKYADEVRVVSIGEFSKELCGGTHVGASGEIGLLKVTGETGIAAGVRRIEAVTGAEAFDKFLDYEQKIIDIAAQLKTLPTEVENRISKLLAANKNLEKELAKATAQQSIDDLDMMLAEAEEVNGVKVVAAKINIDSPKTMRDVGDKLRDKMGSGVAVLGGVFKDKVSLLAIVSQDLTNNYHAGKIVKNVSSMVGGRGGGRPDMAQAGGPMVDKLDDAIKKVAKIISQMSA